MVDPGRYGYAAPLASSPCISFKISFGDHMPMLRGIDEVFSTSALLILQARNDLLLEDVLHLTECLAASLASIH